MNPVIARIRAQFGVVTFSIFSIIALIRVMIERPVSGHYRIFTGAARLLWAKRDPYDFDFHANGPWFYSVNCGMTFFSLFAGMPDLVGLFIYSLACIFSFYFASLYFYGYFYHEPRQATLARKEVQWVLAISGLQIFQAVVAAKIETLMLAIILVGIVAWFKNKRESLVIGSSFLMAMILEWKFQPLPILGLVATVMLISERRVGPFLYLAVSYLFWHFVPALYLGAELYSQLNAHMARSLEAFIRGAYPNYDNIFKFLVSCGVALTFEQAMKLSVAIGGFYFVVVAREVFAKRFSIKELTLLAMALGSVFIVTLSPMSQNNASIVWFPFLVWMFWISKRTPHRLIKAAHIAMVLIFCFSYSDLMTESMRGWLRAYSMKSVSAMIYSLVLGSSLLISSARPDLKNRLRVALLGRN